MITFLSQPDIIQPVYSNLVFQFQSTAATDPTIYKYRYVVNVYTQDGFIAQLNITPSTQGWGQVDLSQILLNYTSSKPVNMGCSGDTPIHQSKWGYLENNMIVYDIMVGEEYATTANGVVSQYNGNGAAGSPSVRSKVCYATNGVKEWFNGKSYDFEPYYLTGQTGTFPQYTSRFLTGSPRTRYIRDTDNALLAATNWYNATGYIANGVWGDTSYTDGYLPSKRVHSALFTFYDEQDNEIGTGRTYNIKTNCGTQENCATLDFQEPLTSNWAEKQIIYVGTGVPNIEENGISVPATTKYYKVELESHDPSNQPEPPDPILTAFTDCSCYEYNYENTGLAPVVVEYYDCDGVYQTFTISPSSVADWCACQNSNKINGSSFDPNLVQVGICDNCICSTYDLVNTDPDYSFTYSYKNCSGDTITGSVLPDDTLRVCACYGSVVAPDLTINYIGTCPLPFSADCQSFAVSTLVSYPLDITYTGCCGNELSITIPPYTSVVFCANNPFPTSILWDVSLEGSCANPPVCPTPTPTPTPVPLPSGQSFIGRNVCTGDIMYFSYSGNSIAIGQYVNYINEVYEITALGGGGFIDLISPWVFDTEASALAMFPCYSATTGTCLSSVVVSEPFYYYFNQDCSPGNRVVFWLGKFGTWESYNFTEREDVGYSVEKQVIQKSPELYSAGWDTPSYQGWNSKRDVWSQKVAQSGILYTDFLPQAESIWLSQEITQSPSVYLVQDNGVLLPITITNTEVAQPNYQINNNKYQFQIEYKAAYDTIRQNHE
jgi:hypothetical protein